MPRRYKRGRGTRHPRGVYSGITLATIPSGVTIDQNGISLGSGTSFTSDGQETAAGFTTSFGAKGYKWASGVVDQASAVSWGTGGASNAYPVATGLSGISTFQTTIQTIAVNTLAGVSPVIAHMLSGGGAVTVITYGTGTAAAILNKGVTARWVAFGLA